MGTNFIARLGLLLTLSGGLATVFASPQQKPQPSSEASDGIPARIKCNDEPYVSLTADAERGFPLRVMATAACNEAVTVLSDPQGYTVRVRTAGGKVGYVTRYEVVISPTKEAAPARSDAALAKPDSAVSAAQGQQTKPSDENGPAPAQKGPSKPRIFISDSQSWSESGGFSGQAGLVPGYNPEMTDVYQNFTSDCRGVTVVQEKSNADYAVLFDKGSSKKGLSGLGGLVKVNKVTVISRSGETLVSQTSRSADTAVQAACNAVAQRTGATTGTLQPAGASH